MKCLSLTQPYATLIARGAKRVETRSWATRYQGPIAIHAAKGFPWDAKDLAIGSKVFRDALGFDEENRELLKTLPRGAVVATATLLFCTEVEDLTAQNPDPYYVKLSKGMQLPLSELERKFGNYSPGRYGYVLGDVRPLVEPIPAIGALGLWEWEVNPEELRYAA